MHIATRKTWLETASLIVVGFGLLVATAAVPPWQGLTLWLTDIIFWPPDGAQSLAAPEARLMSAIGGGVMAGWGTTLWLLVRKLFLIEPQGIKSVILAGMSVWFVIDSTGSLLSGAPLNILLNGAVLVLYFVPLRGQIERSSHF